MNDNRTIGQSESRQCAAWANGRMCGARATIQCRVEEKETFLCADCAKFMREFLDAGSVKLARCSEIEEPERSLASECLEAAPALLGLMFWDGTATDYLVAALCLVATFCCGWRGRAWKGRLRWKYEPRPASPQINCWGCGRTLVLGSAPVRHTMCQACLEEIETEEKAMEGQRN